jgi:hypothetical protein
MAAQPSETHHSDPPDAEQARLGHLTVRELFQRLAACEEALWPTPEYDAGQVDGRERRNLLQSEARILRELRRRRRLHAHGHGAARRSSAAWPPPPW